VYDQITFGDNPYSQIPQFPGLEDGSNPAKMMQYLKEAVGDPGLFYLNPDNEAFQAIAGLIQQYEYSIAPILGRASEIAAHYQGTSDGQTELGLAYYFQTGQAAAPADPAFLAWANDYVYSKIDQAAKDIAKQDVVFGYDLTFEFEASLSNIPLDKNQKLLFAAGLPFTYKYSPGTVVGFEEATENYGFTISPYASLFLTNLALPIQLQLGYTIPVFGNNSAARHIFAFQAKFFFKF
jgi:hypothetical protein